MSLEKEVSEFEYSPIFEGACWPTKVVWNKIKLAYSSIPPPVDLGFQREDYGFHVWTFNSHYESYAVAWDTDRSYWKMTTPFGLILYFVGPLFIEKSNDGLHVPPSFNVIISDTDELRPAMEFKVIEEIKKIVNFVTMPSS